LTTQYVGGKCTDFKTEEGRKRIIEANTKHGFYSAENIADRKEIRAMIRAMRF